MKKRRRDWLRVNPKGVMKRTQGWREQVVVIEGLVPAGHAAQPAAAGEHAPQRDAVEQQVLVGGRAQRHNGGGHAQRRNLVGGDSPGGVPRESRASGERSEDGALQATAAAPHHATGMRVSTDKGKAMHQHHEEM